MKTTTFLSALFIGALALTATPAQALEVTNVTARQRWPWNNLVDIDFVVLTNGTEATTGFALDIGGSFSNGAKRVSATTFTTATEVSAGTNRVTWDLGADYPGMRLSDLALTVTAFPEQTYLVIDLSGGSSAASYPYRYTATPPNLASDACRTDELWLRRVPAGSFAMGSPSGEVGKTTNEIQHAVTLTRGFYIGVFEVTQKQWYDVTGLKPSNYTNVACWATRPVESISYDDIRGSAAGTNWPASSAVDAASFVGKLRARTGLDTLDLPTEAQWEYACRAGTTTSLNSGKNVVNALTSDANLNVVARNKFNSISYADRSVPDTQATAKVGSYQPNAWGLYDMHGNVWERCIDWFDGNLGTAAATDPAGPSFSAGGRSVRSGGCADNPDYCRSVMRLSRAPDSGHARQGLRLAANQR